MTTKKNTNAKKNDARINAILLGIGQQLGFETLETRNSDDLDFNEVAVWAVKAALRQAYDQGHLDAQEGR
jgi:hypothetical protein